MTTIAATTHQPKMLYTQALGKGRALIPEMRTLLEVWAPGESEESLAERVLRVDVLGKATARRVLDVVRVFGRRLLTPTDAPARHLKHLGAPTVPRQVFGDVLFFYVARQDALLWDFTLQRYWPSVRAGRLTVPNRDVAELIWAGEQDGRIAKSWSEEIKRDMAGRVLGILSDFGLLEEFKPARRKVCAYRPADGTVVYLAHLLHAEGVPDGLLAKRTEWQLYGLGQHDVWARLEGLATEQWFVLQRAGQVAHITWKYSEPEEVSRVLARPE